MNGGDDPMNKWYAILMNIPIGKAGVIFHEP